MGQQTEEEQQPGLKVASPENVSVPAPAALVSPAPVPASDLISAAIAGAAPVSDAPKDEEEFVQEASKWATQIANLNDMGFFDIELLTEMLEAEKGDVQRVV